jgi:hypothetical protein
MRRRFGVVLLILTGAHAPSRAQTSSPASGSPQLPLELRTYLQKFIGDAPADCGQYFLARPFAEADASQLQKAVGCGIDSAQAHKPFLAFARRQGIDSTFFEGLLGTADGYIFRFSYDSAPCGGPGCAGSFSIQGCAIPIVNTGRSGYTSLGCRPIGEAN